MSAAAEILIHELAERGVRLTKNADRLRVEAAPGIVTPELRLALSEHKAELLASLSADPIRDRLLRLAAVDSIDPAILHSLPDEDVRACADLPDKSLRAYVRALAETDLRERGVQPDGETARALCAHCGPVWLTPEVAAVAPVVAGWPRVLGCPWCHVEARRSIPRPLVACGDCERFKRDEINPAGGMGSCGAKRKPFPAEPLPYPHAMRRCELHAPEDAR